MDKRGSGGLRRVRGREKNPTPLDTPPLAQPDDKKLSQVFYDSESLAVDKNLGFRAAEIGRFAVSKAED